MVRVNELSIPRYVRTKYVNESHEPVSDNVGKVSKAAKSFDISTRPRLLELSKPRIRLEERIHRPKKINRGDQYKGNLVLHPNTVRVHPFET